MRENLDDIQHKRLEKTLAEFGDDGNDGVIINLDDNNVYRRGVDGEVDINNVSSENLRTIEALINREKFEQKLEISLYWKATLETFTYENGKVNITKDTYTIGNS